MQDMSEQTQIKRKGLEGSGRKRIKEMNNEGKICIILFQIEKKDGEDENIRRSEELFELFLLFSFFFFVVVVVASVFSFTFRNRKSVNECFFFLE